VPGLEFEEEGCRDASDPIDEKAMLLPHRTYFARKSLRWNGSPVFLEKQRSDQTSYGRMYLITEEQFDDIVAQENYLEKDTATWSSLLQARVIARNSGEHTFNHNAWYGTLLYLGTASTSKTAKGCKESWPVFTFTHHTDQKSLVGPPSPLYLDILVRGIHQMTGLACVTPIGKEWEDVPVVFTTVGIDELVAYFASNPCVSSHYPLAEVKRIVEKASLLGEEETEVVDLETDLILENNFMCGSDRGWPCL